MTRACTNCQRRHIRCSGAVTCENCIKRNLYCEFVGQNKKRGPKPKKEVDSSLFIQKQYYVPGSCVNDNQRSCNNFMQDDTLLPEQNNRTTSTEYFNYLNQEQFNISQLYNSGAIIQETSVPFRVNNAMINSQNAAFINNSSHLLRYNHETIMVPPSLYSFEHQHFNNLSLPYSNDNNYITPNFNPNREHPTN
ncbi:11063_t:CDS:1 [Gigaspora margarita]|uniref:11063_t:CDS:1 n=1 Tax=Gigaspora margarita TaxID=4874 RepID=A0ABN7UZG5_GIGMA|nr:11063_t:CDS:1 [Gigaspora margarita]